MTAKGACHHRCKMEIRWSLPQGSKVSKQPACKNNRGKKPNITSWSYLLYRKINHATIQQNYATLTTLTQERFEAVIIKVLYIRKEAVKICA